MRELSLYHPTSSLVYCDTSHRVTGSFIVNCKDSIFHSAWSNEEKGKSSTFRELKAVFLALRVFQETVANRSVKWFSDSQSCVRIVKFGSTKLELQNIAFSIFDICLAHKIDLDIHMVPCSLNSEADQISKLSNTDEWEVSKVFFDFMNGLWGPYDIDRFASYKNRKLERYNSRFLDFESEATDTFTQSWNADNNWLVPPINLVWRTIFHTLECKGRGTLIVPKWPSAAFWPILFDKFGKKQPFVSYILELKSGQGIFTCDMADNCIFHPSRFNSKVLAVKFSQ